MDVVSPELNSLLPDEIMDTEAIEDVPHTQPEATSMVQSEASDDTSVPMETDTPMASESLGLCSGAASTVHTRALTTSTTTDSALSIISGSQIPISISSSSSPLLTLKSALSTSTTKTIDCVTVTATDCSVSTSGLTRLTAPFTISPANHQIILNKVASSQATEAAKTAGTSPQVIKQDGQKLLVTAIGKSGQPIVLQLPHTGSKPGVLQTSGDIKSQTTQFKVVTIGGRTELKPVLGGPGNQLTTLQAQQLKAVQVTLIILL